ncbi:expansin-like EG45 domain-containing protein [Citrus sinensis]|nr:expansin-like EG45 domain-containing protein [Citrus sinensis]
MLSRIRQALQWLSFLLFISQLICNTSFADVGTAARYGPPFLRNSFEQFIAAAGDGIWDNGAICGRQYLVRCISASEPGTCEPEQTIQIRIVDYALQLESTPSVSGTTIVLSETAFRTIANSTATLINVEFQQ